MLVSITLCKFYIASTYHREVADNGRNSQKYSRKWRCPLCNGRLEILPFLDWNYELVEYVYSCQICGDFWAKYELKSIEERKNENKHKRNK